MRLGYVIIHFSKTLTVLAPIGSNNNGLALAETVFEAPNSGKVVIMFANSETELRLSMSRGRKNKLR